MYQNIYEKIKIRQRLYICGIFFYLLIYLLLMIGLKYNWNNSNFRFVGGVLTVIMIFMMGIVLDVCFHTVLFIKIDGEIVELINVFNKKIVLNMREINRIVEYGNKWGIYYSQCFCYNVFKGRINPKLFGCYVDNGGKIRIGLSRRDFYGVEYVENNMINL